MSEGTDQSIFAVGSMRATVVRLLPSYQASTAKRLAIAEIVLAVVVVIIGGVAIAVKAFTSVGGTAIVTGILVALTGVMGMVSSFQRTVWAITGYLLFSICSFILSFALIIASVIGMTTEYKRLSHVNESGRVAIDISVMVIGVAIAITTCWSSILCGTNLFHGCCKKTSGVKYIKDPNKNEGDVTSPVRPENTGEPEEFDLADGPRDTTNFTQSTDSAVLS